MSNNKIKVSEEALTTIKDMLLRGFDRQEIADEIGRSKKDLGEILNEYHLVSEMPMRDMEAEMDMSEKVYTFWEDLGFENINMKVDSYGYNRSDLVNGLPRGMKKYIPSIHGEIDKCAREKSAVVIEKNRKKNRL